MMGLAKMAPDGWAYYAREVAAGSEDYFVGHGEEPGRWIGAGCEAIGVAGIADEEGLARLFGGGRHPVCGIPLGRPFDPARSGSVAGYALSFSPPKSVSVLWALADPEITREVRGAHDAAVSVALSFLEEHAAFTRRGHGGLIQEDTSGLLAAAFVHRTSRAGDPQLHTHVLVANKVRAASDSVWLALDGRELFEVQKAAGLVYKAGLRAELTSRLGVCWTQIDVDGAAEIVGVPEELTAHFSKRRGQVTALAAGLVAEREEVLGRSLTSPERAVIHQLAAYQSRAAKSRSGESTAELRSRWRAEATAVAGDPEAWIAALANRHEPTPLRAVPRRPGAADDPARRIISALEQAHSTWGRSDLIEALAVHVVPPAAGTADDVRRLLEVAADHILAQQEVVALDSLSPLDVGGHETRRDGMAPTSRHGGRRYSTWQTLAREQQILDNVEAGRDMGVATVPEPALQGAIGDAGLSADQQGVVERLCRDGDTVSVVIGPAGSGKSHTLSAARQAWSAAGVPVRGVAPSAVAAGVLTERADICSETLAKFLHDARRSQVRLQRGEVVVCDEASMVSTRDLAVLANWVRRAEAKLVLVGDPQQLGAVEAGGLFRLLAADSAAELTGIHRFANPWEAEATRRLRRQDTSVIDTYRQHGRISAGDRDSVLDEAHRAWVDARRRGQSVLVMAVDHETVDQLANRARAARVTAGEVEPNGIEIGNQTVGVGDEIVTLHNDRRLVTTTGAWVRNGDRWTVAARSTCDSLRLHSLDGRGHVTIPGEYVADNVALAYAVTVHKAQGVTVDRAVLVVDGDTASEHLYVGLTRGRFENLASVVYGPFGSDDHGSRATSARDVLKGALQRTSNQASATEALREYLDKAATRRLSSMRQRRQAFASTRRASAAESTLDNMSVGPEL